MPRAKPLCVLGVGTVRKGKAVILPLATRAPATILASNTNRESGLLSRFNVVIVGAGLAGLCCALELQRRQVDCIVVESSDDVGGRVRTDEVDGFLLDRGFQVLLTAYPECRRILDYRALKLRCFEHGAVVRTRGEFFRVSDPWRDPWHALESLRAPVGSLMDKLRIVALQNRAMRGPLAELFKRPEKSTEAVLRQMNFSPRMIDTFFRPFLGGIFLGRRLDTSSRMLDFVFRMMALGDTAVPDAGMGAIPKQIVGRLAPGTVRLNSAVASVSRGVVTMASGERIEADHVVLAVDGPSASRVTGGKVVDPGSRAVVCHYFGTDSSPGNGRWLVLNGERGKGPINNVVTMSDVAPNYAPAGSHLVSVTTLPEREQPRNHRKEVIDQLANWYGPVARRWQHLRSYVIRHGQPEQAPGFRERAMRQAAEEVVLCGDYTGTASIHGAMLSGRRAAARILGKG